MTKRQINFFQIKNVGGSIYLSIWSYIVELLWIIMSLWDYYFNLKCNFLQLPRSSTIRIDHIIIIIIIIIHLSSPLPFSIHSVHLFSCATIECYWCNITNAIRVNKAQIAVCSQLEWYNCVFRYDKKIWKLGLWVIDECTCEQTHEHHTRTWIWIGCFRCWPGKWIWCVF